jgi:hypothetical protein
MSVFRKMNMFTLCVAKGFMFISCTELVFVVVLRGEKSIPGID